MIQKLSDAYSISRILLEALVQKITCLLTHEDIGRDGYFIFDDLNQLLLTCDLERILTHQHLVKHNAQRPNIYLLVILLSLQDLRAYIQWRAAEGCPERVIKINRPSEIA